MTKVFVEQPLALSGSSKKTLSHKRSVINGDLPTIYIYFFLPQQIQSVLVQKSALYLWGLYPLLIFYTNATAAAEKLSGKTLYNKGY